MGHFTVDICSQNGIKSVMIEYLLKEGFVEIRTQLESICRRETEAMLLEENSVQMRKFIHCRCRI